MSKIPPSRSPDRHTFQKENYIRRQQERGEAINPDYIDFFDKIIEDRRYRLDQTEYRENDMEYDLVTTPWIVEKVRASDRYAQNLYAAMCNQEFRKLEVMEILKESRWSCSWRYSGGIIADMRGQGDYIDWYCSGIGEGLGNGDADGTKDYVGEGVVTSEIREDLERLGWVILPEG